MSVGGSGERRREGLGYLRLQLIIVDFPWIRKRGGVYDDPSKKERYLNPV